MVADIREDWPNRAASRYVDAGGLRWHVQSLGDAGPDLLLLHGTGAATHSWAGLAPLLSETSTQAQFLIPAAVALGYGIMFATLITLILIPVLVAIQHDVTEGIGKLKQRLLSGSQQGDTDPC